jgi:hypothetical protein
MAAGRAGERVAERVVPQVMERGGLPAEMLGAMAQGTQSPATVFHGSPHLFQRFDASKIGTGEGNQTFGYGLYLAENRATAEDYARTLSRPDLTKLSDPARKAFEKATKEIVRKTGDASFATPTYTANLAASKAKGQVAEELMQYADNPPPMMGNIYQVDLPDEQIARMLDFDKPLSQQAQPVREALSRLGIAVDDRRLADFDDALLGALTSDAPAGALPRRPMNMTGEEVIKELQRNPSRYLPQMMQGRELTQAMINPAQGASAVLRQAGIPGIRYLDQGSRAVPNITNQRLANLYAKHGGNAEAAVDEMMRSVYNSPKKKAEMREQFMKQLQTQTPKTSNFVVFPGMEDMLRIEQINEQPIQSLFQSLGR